MSFLLCWRFDHPYSTPNPAEKVPPIAYLRRSSRSSFVQSPSGIFQIVSLGSPVNRGNLPSSRRLDASPLASREMDISAKRAGKACLEVLQEDYLPPKKEAPFEIVLRRGMCPGAAFTGVQAV
jgi:hypothetical protein